MHNQPDNPYDQMSEHELRQVIRTYELGWAKRVVSCIALATTGIVLATFLGKALPPPPGYLGIAVGFIIACTSTIPAGRNMILRDRADAARATLCHRSHHAA